MSPLRQAALRRQTLIGGSAWLILALVMAGLSVYSLVHAARLQTRLDHAVVGDRVVAQLRDELAARAGSRVLRPVVHRLLQEVSLPLRYVAVFDGEGVLLTQAGIFQSVEIPVLPEGVSVWLRRVLYAFTGSVGQRRVLDEEGRLLGSVEYRLGPTVTAVVREEAIEHLRRTGWLVLLLALLMLTLPALMWWRARGITPEWVRRADPRRTGAALAEMTAGGGPAAAAMDEFRSRAGHVMDALSYGIIATDRDGRVRFLNATAERLTGWNLADARGRLVYSICHVLGKDDALEPSAAERSLQQLADVPAYSARLRTRHGEIRPVETMACLLRARDGAVDGVTMVLRDNSRQVGEMDALRREARLSQAVVDHLDEGLLMTDPAGVVRIANARAERMFGYSRHELEGFTVTKLMPVPFLNSPGVRISDYIAGRSAQRLPKVVGWRKDATTFPVELWVQTMSFDDTSGLVVIVRDISERLRGENLATRLGRLLDSALEEVFIFDAQTLRFLEVNRGARRNLAYGAEELARMSPLEISADLDPEAFQNFLNQLRGGEQEHLIYRCSHRRRDGSTYPVEVRLNYSREEEPPVFMAIAVDIGDRLVAEEKLQHLAHHDSLTGLPNRVMLYDRISQARLLAQRTTRLMGVFFLDLDRFKQINDQHGHDIGDAVLKAVAERLKSAVRPTDTVARLAGDEFVVLAPGLRTPEDASFLAQKLVDRFSQPLDIPGLEIVSRASIGITLYPLDESDVEGLLRHADAAMYDAKQAGRGCYRLFGTEVDPEKRRRLELEREIHSAVALNQFHLQMLPVIDVQRGIPRAMLSNLYWMHPRYGRIEHDELLRAAGRAGLLGDLELWQVCRACEHHLSAHEQGLPLLPVVIDISGWQLRDREFSNHVLELLDRYDAQGDRLLFALTPDGMAEAVGMHPEAERLLARGVRLALRDFNSAPALESTLSATLLVAGEHIASNEEVARAMLSAANRRGAVVVAGAVATADMRARWAAIGCNLLAGAAVEPALEGPQALAWLQGRPVDPL